MLSAILSQLPPALQHPKLGIVCGSGLGGLGDILADKVMVPYSAIPGFGVSTGEHSSMTRPSERALISRRGGSRGAQVCAGVWAAGREAGTGRVSAGKVRG